MTRCGNNPENPAARSNAPRVEQASAMTWVVVTYRPRRRCWEPTRDRYATEADAKRAAYAIARNARTGVR